MTRALVFDTAAPARLARVLAAEGLEAGIATSPSDALVSLRANAPALIVGDLHLNDEGAAGWVDHLLRDVAVCAVPILFCVDAGTEALARRMAWTGSEVLVMPAEDHQIAEAVRRMLGTGMRPAGLAHELNNQLTTVIGHARLLAESATLSESDADNLHRVLDAATRAAALTAAFLTPRSQKLDDDARTEPVRPTWRTSSAPLSATRDPAAPATVLVVEDERPIRFLVGQILRRAGYEVAEAASPVEAMAWLDAHGRTVCLIISDLSMPGADSSGFFERITGPQATSKVLFISGRGIGSVPTAHPVPFLPKPFTSEQLLREVSAALGPEESAPR